MTRAKAHTFSYLKTSATPLLQPTTTFWSAQSLIIFFAKLPR